MKKNIKEIGARIAGVIGAISASSASISCDDLAQKTNTGVMSFINTIADIYCNSVFFLLLLINVGILLISKNDKVVGASKKTLIGLIVFYILLKMFGTDGSMFSNFIETIANNFK